MEAVLGVSVALPDLHNTLIESGAKTEHVKKHAISGHN